MKCTTSGFLYIFGMYELHRHAPGILKSYQEGISDSEPPSWKDTVLLLELSHNPPRILVSSVGAALQGVIEEQLDGILAVFEKFHRVGLIPIMVSNHDAREDKKRVLSVPMDLLSNVEGEVYVPGNTPDLPNPVRAQILDDESGAPLPFVLDEVDAVMMEALQNFRPPSSNDGCSSTSPRMIYDYVKQIVAGRQRESWTKAIDIRNPPLDAEEVCSSGIFALVVSLLITLASGN